MPLNRQNSRGTEWRFDHSARLGLDLPIVVVMPFLICALQGASGLEWTVRVASYLAMLVVVSGLAALYRWGPGRRNAKWRWITPGTVLSVVALGITSILFSWSVSNFSDDNATYGSLGAVIGLMSWLWISVTLVVIGAELNSEIEHQTARDSTTGPDKPLGARGAKMADTVGRAWPLDREKVEAEPANPRRKKRLSLGALAFALPAAAALRYAARRGR